MLFRPRREYLTILFLNLLRDHLSSIGVLLIILGMNGEFFRDAFQPKIIALDDFTKILSLIKR